MYLVERRYQFLLLFVVNVKKKYAIIDKYIFMSILDKRMYIFIKHYVSHEQLQFIIKEPEVIHRLVIDPSDRHLLFY